MFSRDANFHTLSTKEMTTTPFAWSGWFDMKDNRDEGEFRISLIYNSLIKGQVKFSKSGNLHDSPRTADNRVSDSWD